MIETNLRYIVSIFRSLGEVMIIMVSPSFLGDIKLADAEFFQDFELPVCFFSWRILATDAIEVPLFCRLVFEMEVDGYNAVSL